MSRKENRKKRKLSYGNKGLTKRNISPNKFPIDTGSEFMKALKFHQSGQLHRAEEIYKKILETNPNHSESLHLLGIIAHQANKHDIAVYLINKAIQCNPGNSIYYNNLGIVLKDQGKLVEAVSSYQKALKMKPDHAVAYNNMGNAYREQGKLVEAVSSYQKALEIKPDYAVAYNNLGNVFKDQGKLVEAISFYQKALEIKPDYATVYYNLGNAYKDQGKPVEAISSYQKTLEINPDYAEAYNNIGTVFKDQGKLTEAISFFQKALEFKPDYAEAYYNLGIAFKDQDKPNEAISSYQKALEIKPDYAEAYNNMGAELKDQGKLTEAISCFQKALEIRPDYVEAHNNIGIVLKDQGALSEVISCFEKSLEIKPDYAEAHNNIGAVFKDQGKLVEAVSCFQKALEIKPDYAEAYYNLGIVFKDQNKPDEAISSYQKTLEIKPDFTEAYSELFHQFQRTCAWQKLEGMAARLDEITTKALDRGIKTTESPFVSLARGADMSRNFAISKSRSCNIDRAMSSLKINFSFDGRESRKTKIVIGYLSNDFRNHPMSHLTLSLYGLHNRDEFKIFCYSYGEDDGSYYRKRIQQDCDKFVDIRNLNHTDVARRIYEDQVDILVDFKGYTGGSRLEISALRPAPIRVRYLGLPCTTGADFFDYIITDRIVTPEDYAQYYTEDFVYLPHCYQINDNTQTISNKDWEKSDFGLPEGGFVFCSFNQGYKIEPVMFDTWMNILRRVPESVLWLQRESEVTEKNIRREAEKRGVKSTRLVFSERLSKDKHLGRLRLADIALDTRIINGIITTSDALWAGVPVITLQGGSFASRVSSSILTAIGLPELITRTIEDYEFLAVGLAHDTDKLQMVRRKIAENSTVEPLFDTPGFTKDLERAYKEMWEIFAAGKMPGQIEVAEI